MEREDVLQLVADILGGELYDEDIPWKRTGAAGGRNFPLEGLPDQSGNTFVTRILNAFNTSIEAVEVTSDELGDALISTVGKHHTDDKVAFESIGSNLIQAVSKLIKVSEDFTGIPEWNSETYTLTFQSESGNVRIDLPLAELLTDVSIDIESQELVLQWFKKEERVDISYLFTLYTGGETSTTKVSIDDNIIKVTAKLSSEVDNAIEVKADGLYVPKITKPFVLDDLSEGIQESLGLADKIVINGVGDKFLANDGDYRGIELFVDHI